MPPAPTPSSVARELVAAPGLSDITMTPAVAIMIATAMAGVTRSPRNIRPNNAT